MRPTASTRSSCSGAPPRRTTRSRRRGYLGSLTLGVGQFCTNPGLLFVPEDDRVGRLIFNGWPTGVAVCWATHHGGPWPASTAPSTTSAGATAIRRWLQPIAYQNFPDELLPRKLQRAYPMAVQRLTQPPGGH